ncbi:MAG: DUF167 domain-containing protein [Desulfobacca sp.]|uniref:DUF167 domain-containing protein n=1 Tax=Desulfobacca sp. TaxID=2067990 RepID=UPI00404A1C6C
MTAWLQPTCSGWLLKVQISPGAAQNQIVGEHGDRLKIRIAAPPAKGAANRTLLEFLAQRLGIAKQQLRLKSGTGDRLKVVEIDGLEPELRERLLDLTAPR